MGKDDSKGQPERRDFFISYTGQDRQWAEWIAMQLEQTGYTLFIQAWDFRPGSNFVVEMDKAAKCAERTLIVLSPAYLESEYAYAEWTAAFRYDPTGVQRRVLPVRIQPCVVDGLLGSVVYIDLVSLEEEQAIERLLSGVQQGRVKPTTVAFPGQSIPHAYASFPGPLPTLWNIPHLRNPVFTGREQLLAHLAEKLHPGEAVAFALPQALAISGLGGIGKTQLAVEYAYRHRQDYQAVFWTRADTTDALVESYGEIARLLQLPEKEEQDQSRVVKAVQEWLRTQTKWLMIFDNADDLTLVRTYLPSAFGGHILLTTRTQSIGGLAAGITVNILDKDIGALLLLRRAGLVAVDASLDAAPPSDLSQAKAIAEELGGLPLALDQAGAYIEETECDLAGYRRLYQTRRAELLQSRRGFVGDHPEPVATTWSLSFAQVKQGNPAAADLLRLCAFLAPDAIPEELLTKGAKELGDVLASVAADAYLLDQAIMALRAYSLIQRDPKGKALSIHRLVQAVLQDQMTEAEIHLWAERAVLAVSVTFPDEEYGVWPQGERLLSQALAATELIEQHHFIYTETEHLLVGVAFYLHKRYARYQEAERLYQQALRNSEQHLGLEHLKVASPLFGLASLYQEQGKYVEAEPLYQRSLRIKEQQLGLKHPALAPQISGLASLYYDQGKYAEAALLYQRSLAIIEQQLGQEHPGVAYSLHHLAGIYQEQGKHAEAEQFYRRALRVYEQNLGSEHPELAYPLEGLASLYSDQGKYVEAEQLYQRVLQIREQNLGLEHPAVASPINGLANIYRDQGKHVEAEQLYQRALQIREQNLGLEHPAVAVTLTNLANLYREQKKYTEAEQLYWRALRIREQSLGPRHLGIMYLLSALVDIYLIQRKFAEAEPLYQRALSIYEQQLGPEHPSTQMARQRYAILLQMVRFKGNWKRILNFFSLWKSP